MGCRILDGGSDGAVLYCSTSEWAFGPRFQSVEHAEDFLRWFEGDPRSLNQAELEAKHLQWHQEHTKDGELLEELVCPKCEEGIGIDDSGVSRYYANGEWYGTCPWCHTDITSYSPEPEECEEE